MISVNKVWAQSVSFSVFCKDANIKKLNPDEQKALYEKVTNKKVKTKRVVKYPPFFILWNYKN